VPATSRCRARLAARRTPRDLGGAPLTSSTPDALWSSRSVRLLHPAAVKCAGLRRRLGRQRLLDGVDLTVPVGARLLLMSHPAASASLLLRVLAGLARPSAGTYRLAGLTRSDASSQGWARRVAYVGPESAMYAWMSPREILELSGRLAGYDRADTRRRADAMVERYRLGPGLDRPIGRSAAALAQRTALAAAMVTDPEVVLLDEPLRSCDPDERRRLLQLPDRRRTVLLASHLPTGETELVNQIALIRDGRLVLHAPTADLERAGLPLSIRGVDQLAELRSPGHRAAAAAR
jgi:ABC-2 type transport system ATP-binding protein